MFYRPAQIFAVWFPSRNTHDSACSVCHSEERSDEESAFLTERIGKRAKQMLHGVYPEIAEGFSITRQQTRNALEDFFGGLCVSPTSLRADFWAKYSDSFGCGSAALGLGVIGHERVAWPWRIAL
jgi:hypothetical protein